MKNENNKDHIENENIKDNNQDNIEIESVIDDDEINYLINKRKNEEKLDAVFKKITPGTQITNESEKSQVLDEARKRVELDSEVIETFCEIMKHDTNLKRFYARILIIVLIVQLIFTGIIVYQFGRGILYYSDVVFNIYISGSLIEIIGLVMVIVRYLFKDNISKTLKDILTHNKIKTINSIEKETKDL